MSVKEFHRKSCTEGGNDRTLPGSDDGEGKEKKREYDGQQDTADVKADLYVSEFFVGGVRNCLDKDFSRVHDHVGDDRQGDAED